jgi:Heparinase II/III-like protein
MNTTVSFRIGLPSHLRIFLTCFLGLIGVYRLAGSEAVVARPNIWVRAADRGAILEKIEKQAWARTQFDALVARSADRVGQHQADVDAYLRALPWTATTAGGHPVLPPITDNMASTGRASMQSPTQAMLTHAIDSGVLYYLTGDTAYAAVSGDVLQALVQSMNGLKPSESPSNGGWLYPNDHLYEARILGAQIPILYDFVADYLRRPEVTVWDLATKKRVPFDFAGAQKVFRTYTQLAVEHGMQTSSNWPVLEMPSLTHNALALEDATERAHWLGYVTHVDAARQDPLNKIVSILEEVGGVWPESFGYANDVASKVTYIVALLGRQPSGLELPKNVGNVSRSMQRLREFRYPNGDMVRFGDGARRNGLPLKEYEMAYSVAVREKDAVGMAEFGGVLRAAIEDGSYDRSKLGEIPSGAHVYLAPLSLLWFAPEIEASARVSPPLPTTDELPYAGLVLQRNLSPDGQPEHGLMAAVHGSKFIHGHASGMSLELYGAGYVLGTNAGKGTYGSDEHENYRRLFAGYNSVIVNGSSSTSGGWANLGTDTVRRVEGEPAKDAKAVSPRHSFTITRFTDQQVGGTKADQERTVGIVRTSDQGGYYVDIFRSRIAQTAQTEQFHDYVFHQVGDKVEWRGAKGPAQMTPAPDRFQPVPSAKWAKNRSFLYPGWHYFKEVGVASLSGQSLVADFFGARIGKSGVGSRLHVPAGPGREYVQAMSPVSHQGPEGYEKLPMPVVVIRQQGEAWDRPFAVVHEPYTGTDTKSGIREVTALKVDGKWKGLIVRGASEQGAFRHYLLIPAPEQPVVRSAELGLKFEGRYAWIAVDAAGEPIEIYVGQGTSLNHRGVTLRRADGKAFSARAEKTREGWRITSPNTDGIKLSADISTP